MIKHYNITISGKVQGVFFRKYTADKAIQLSLHGFVRNEPDGNVYCEAEGEEETLEQFIQWCRKGSPLSHVTGVQVKEGAISIFPDFTIKK